MDRFKAGDKVVQIEDSLFKEHDFPPEQFPVLTVNFDKYGGLVFEEQTEEHGIGHDTSRFKLLEAPVAKAVDPVSYVYIDELSDDQIENYRYAPPYWDGGMRKYFGTIQPVKAHGDSTTLVGGYLWLNDDVTTVSKSVDVSKLEVGQYIYLSEGKGRLHEVQITDTRDDKGGMWRVNYKYSDGTTDFWWWSLDGLGDDEVPTIVAVGPYPSATKVKLDKVEEGLAAIEYATQQFNTETHTPDTDIDAILEERGSRYGSFDEHARITQAIKAALVSGTSWDKLTDAQKESLEMQAHKMGRIVNGDPNYKDSWTDIIGYTKLVEETL